MATSDAISLSVFPLFFTSPKVFSSVCSRNHLWKYSPWARPWWRTRFNPPPMTFPPAPQSWNFSYGVSRSSFSRSSGPWPQARYEAMIEPALVPATLIHSVHPWSPNSSSAPTSAIPFTPPPWKTASA